MTPTSPEAVEAMYERLMAGDLCTVELAPEAAAMLREWCARAIAAEAEAAMLRRERDEARDQFDHHVVWASDQSAKLEAEAAALREALREIEALEIDWRLSTAENMRAASDLARAALKETSDEIR